MPARNLCWCAVKRFPCAKPKSSTLPSGYPETEARSAPPAREEGLFFHAWDL
jgi:hypothetical protein